MNNACIWSALAYFRGLKTTAEIKQIYIYKQKYENLELFNNNKKKKIIIIGVHIIIISYQRTVFVTFMFHILFQKGGLH